jgi:hypothetical protein
MPSGRPRVAGQVEGDGQVGQRNNLQIHRIAHCQRTRRYRERRTPAERQNAVGPVGNRATAFMNSDVRSSNCEWLRAQHVR